MSPTEETPNPTTPSRSEWKEVESALVRHVYKPDILAARALYSAIAAHYLPDAPVWPMLVAPPGSLKTELLNGMDGMSRVHFIDNLTTKTFLSGQINDGTPAPGGEQEPSLLKRIGSNGLIVYPDFSTVISMPGDDKGKILADMRRIYDGKLSKSFGTRQAGDVVWKGRITFAVAVTPDIDGHYSVFQTLGERFIMVRWPRFGGVETALAAMNQNNAEAKAEIGAAVRNILNTRARGLNPSLSDSYARRIAAISEIACRGRTHIPRTGYAKEIVYVPEAESNTRLAQQLCQLAKGSALLENRSEVNEKDFALVKRAAFDSLPPARSAILQTLIDGRDLKTLKLPGSTRTYAVEDLVAQDLLEKDGNRPPRLSPLAEEMVEMAGLHLCEPPEEIFTECTPTPHTLAVVNSPSLVGGISREKVHKPLDRDDLDASDGWLTIKDMSSCQTFIIDGQEWYMIPLPPRKAA